MKYQKGDFLVVPNVKQVLEMRGAPLNVYLALLARANKKGVCWPSYEHLAEITGFDQRVCKRAINSLVEDGLIWRGSRYGTEGRQTTNVYQLLIKENLE